MQLTHKENYQKAGDALDLDLVENPDQVATPEVGFKVAVWYWNSRELNSLADQNTLDAFKQITYKINGGQNGAVQREKYWNKAKEVLGCAGRKRSKIQNIMLGGKSRLEVEKYNKVQKYFKVLRSSSK
jgi:hypothetical protein